MDGFDPLHQTRNMHLSLSQVRKAFYRFAGNDDLGSFMRVLGYPGFESTSVAPGDEGQLIDIFQQAMSTTSDQQL